jgi:hypothetical protein
MVTKVTKSNTKAEILEAYEKLQKDFNDKVENNPQEVQKRKDDSKTLEKVANHSEATLKDQLQNVQKSFDKNMQELQDKIIGEYKVLDDIQKSIQLEKQHLEDLYGIKANADTLAASLIAQKENKELFEKEMLEKRTSFELEIKQEKEQWDLQKQKHKEEEKEYIEQLNKNRKREEEEYQYKLDKKRQEEKDKFAYEMKQLEQEISTKRSEFEKEFSEREQKIVKSEEELNSLRKQVENFPSTLEKEIKKAKEDTEKDLAKQFKFEKELREKEVEGKENLYKQEIASLKTKISEMQNQVSSAIEKAISAEKSVKDIALRAIDSSKKLQIFERKNQEED